MNNDSPFSPRPSSSSRPVSERNTPAPAGTDPLLEGLNPQQEQAVTHSGTPLLIVAGAGSGKTAVLTTVSYTHLRAHET